MVDPIPQGMDGLIPHLVVNGAAAAIDFYEKAFDAQELGRAEAPGGGKIMHAAITIDGRPLFLADDFPEVSGRAERDPTALGATTVTVHRYVTDVDAAVAKAEAAGATVTMAPDDMFWGDRYAVVRDPFGHQWSFSTQVREVSDEEVASAAAEAFAQS